MSPKELDSTAEAVQRQLSYVEVAGLPGEAAPGAGVIERTMSFPQQRMWFMEMLGNMGDAYRVYRWMELEGDLDQPALQRALDRIVERHEAWRSTFHSVDGRPVQRIHPAEGSRLPVGFHDVSGHADPEAECRRLAADRYQEGYDLERGPLVRGHLIRISPQKHHLLICVHHIACDAWSTGLFDAELGALYGAFSRGEPDPLPPLPTSYSEYAEWQRDRIERGEFSAQANYWREALSGAPELLEVPTDHPRPARQDFAGEFVETELDETLAAQLKALSQRNGTTMFVTVLAAWATVLSRLSGQEEVVVGTPVASRRKREITRLIGLFVNTVAIRVDLSGSPGVAELLQRIKTQSAAAQRHQDIPLEQVVEAVQPTRSAAYTPLFQALFSWGNAYRGTLEVPGLTVSASGVWTPVKAMFSLSLVMKEMDGRIWTGLGYATSIFERETVERHAGYLRSVLEAMVADDRQPVDRLPLLRAGERRQLVEEWNATDAEYPSELCVHELFEQQAERTPGAVAVSFEDRTLTYAELNARANQLAHHLRALGVGPDACVGICLERGLEMMVGLLAILKAGGAYVPLDPDYPADRLQHMLRDSAPVAVLTQRGLRAVVADAGAPLLVLDEDAATWADQPRTNPARGALTPEHLAYVIYTSGSTGMPKGVMNHHRCLVNRLAWGGRAWPVGAGQSVLCKTSLGFDGSIREVFLPLAGGGRVVMAHPEGHRDPDYLVDVIRRERITVVNLVPSMLQVLLEHPEVESCTVLERVLCGGEALPATLLRRFRERLPGVELHNLYGPSEAATAASMRVRLDDDARTTVPIGRPMPNTRIYLLDAQGEPVPVGVSGELYVGGAGVARGYLNRPELTRERFVADPFSPDAGARLYRTGDLGRWLPDGTVEFLGRNDFQVKIRGFRVELGEIEACVAAHPQVRETVVLAREDVPGEKRLVAYYVAPAELPVEALRDHLQARLPDYMVPAACVWLERLPLNPNGKLDRKALPAPEGDAFVSRAYEAPRGWTEEALAGIWGELLGVERVGRLDHFFELGGHSLRAVQLVSRVRQVLGVDVKLGDVFARPVLAELAEGLGSARGVELPPIGTADRDRSLPLSFAQQRLWFLEQLDDLGATYHVSGGLRLRGELDRDALRRALDRIVERHEALRTTFVKVDGEPVQRISPAGERGFHLAEQDLRGAADPRAELKAVGAHEAAARFDLEHGPLIRGRLVQLADDDHALLLTMHHVVSDGWSMRVMMHELGALYGAFHRGDADPLSALPVQYADYAVWQRRWVDGEVLQQQADYWTRTLVGAPALLEVPTDRPRAAVQDHRGAALELELDGELLAGLRALGQRHGATLFMTLLAGWATVLSRLSGQDEVVIGTPSANRNRGEIEGLIGFFVNTLPLRVDLSGSPRVAELLGRVKERTLGAQQNQDIPFEQVVERVQPTRSMAHTPLFQAMFSWQNAEEGTAELPGLSLSALERAEHVTAKFDLTLILREQDGRIVGGVEYATALFDASTVERYLGYLRSVLQAMVAGEEQTTDCLPLLSPAERTQVVETWNATDAEFPRASCVHQLFEQRAARTPEAVAVVHGDEELTYAQLNARANRLAHHLRERGVGAGEYVAILVPRSSELVAAQLAVLKTGAAYVPIDPTFPIERVAFMVADCGARFVLDRRGAAPLDLPGTERVDIHVAMDADGAAENLALPQTGEAAAYVMYTSGSTGEPKGVVVPHRAIARLVINNGYADFNAADRVAFAANPAFDASTLEVWAPLLGGGCVVVIDAQVLLDPQAFARVLERQAVSVLWMTVGLFNQYVDSLTSVLPRLRYLIVGGDALDPRIIARVLRERAPQHLLNGYGPTETTTFAITHEITQVAEGARSIPLGRPISNTRIYLLDAAGEPVPVGVAGEIHIGGAGVALGYLNRPELTEERFVADPFSGEANARMYRAGDLGRWLPDGTIEFLGRNDFQVKIRGFRIELGEIEARLSRHAQIRETAVLAREDAPGDKRLVAYYVADAELDVEVLREHLLAELPEYMVPAAYVRMERLPLTGNGKVDRRALPAPECDAYLTREYEAPVGETEEALAQVWAELLRVERVGRGDDFFALGGHSLRAVQLVSRVRQALGVEIALGDLFTRPVLAEFAQAVESARRAELPPITVADRTQPLPLSFAQQRLWFLEKLGDLGATYHMAAGLRLRGELDVTALRGALDHVVARHEALRTTFVAVEDQPVQRVLSAEESGFALVEHDLRGSDGAAAELERLSAEEASAPFDLAHGPLVRGRLVRLADEDHVLLVTMHHIVSDGWSVGVMTRELSALYEALRRGAASPLPALAVQYADYAAWQRRWVDGDVLQKQADYWTSTLTGAPELLELPTDRPRPAVREHAGAGVSVELDESLAAGLKALGQRHGTTLFHTLLAGWATVLGRLSGQDEVVIGTPSANRGRAEVEGLIGFFVNTLPLRVDLAGSPRVTELLGRVKERALGAQQNQDIPFEQVVERVQPARSMAHTPLFQVMFSWQNTEAGTLELPGLSLEMLEAEHVTAKFDLALTLREQDGRIVGGVEYATALFDTSTVERHVGYLRSVLEAMVAADEQPTDRLPMLSAAERRLVVEEWNATDVEYPTGICIHELFEQQAERTPNAVAVSFEGGTLTYAELNARANRLAHHLRALGVGPDARVGICVERSVEMVAGLFAILKAGGGYVPLDPSYPADRLEYMLRDSAPTTVLTQRSLRGLVAGAAVPMLTLDEDAGSWAAQPETNPARGELRPDHLAYVIYTSGSTGMPKGVMNQHDGVVNRLQWMQDAYRMDSHEAVLQKTPFGFDVSVWEFFWPLMTGARLVVARPEGHKDPAYLAETIRGEQVTTLHFVPSMLQLFVEHADVVACTGLKRVVCSGEALPAALVRRFHERLPGVELHNLYGPTEAAVDVTAWHCPAKLDVTQVPIGRPIANTRIYVLDAHGEPVPVGVAGELYIGGVQVARGYLNRPELTEERFVADPFSADAGARLYRTGDLARWLADGSIEYLGRNDFQVKIRGFRIELGEIEARLAGHLDVREAAVLAREDGAGDKRLVAYYVADAEVGIDTLRAHLLAHLPEYMVPAAYVWLQALPLTPNGKLDRKALPAPEGDAFLARAYEAPRSGTEEALAEIWAELLDVERVGRNDHFFELGGHSLMAVTLIERMRRRGLHADVRTLFGTPTLAELAAAVRAESYEVQVPENRIPRGATEIRPEMLSLVELSQEQIDRIVAAVPGGAANVQDVYPLAPVQEGMLFHHLMAGEGDPYLLTHLLRFDAREQLDAFAGALQAVIARHDTLRSAVLWDGLPEPVQVVRRSATLAVEEVQLDGGDVAEQLFERFHPRHFRIDVRQAPLLRGYAAYDAAHDRWLLLVLMHHLVGDHTTVEVVLREVNAHLEGREAALPEPLPFRNFVAQARLGVSRAEHEAFFREMLGTVDEPTAPFGLLDVQGDGSGMVEARQEVDAALGERLRERARRLGVSVASLCHVAFAQVLARATGRKDVVFGTILFGRMQGGEGADRVVGPFVNTLPLRLDVEAGAEAGVRHAHTRLAELMRHEHAPLTLAQRCSGVQAPAPLFSALMNYRHAAEPAQGGGVHALRVEERTNYPLMLTVDDRGPAGLLLEVQVQAAVEAPRVCALMHTALEGLAEALENTPERPLRTLPVLPAAERRLVVEEWNDTAVHYPLDLCIHELVEAQVARTPGAPAVIHGDRALTYAELNARANRLAHHLRALGVEPDARVGICMARGVETVVALLAVLKAGGAYLPLDPAYPADRLRYMLADSAPVALLGDGDTAARFPGADVPVLDVCAADAAWADQPETNPERGALRPDHLAYLIYTSGSTGLPKGVMLEHRNAVNFLCWGRDSFDRAVLERTLFSTSLNFDLAVFELFVPLVCGAAVQVTRDALEMADTQVTLVNTVPSVMRALVGTGGVPRSVHTVNLAGEPLTEALFERIIATTGAQRVCNLYGPSETTTYSTWVEMKRGEPFAPHVGRPIANTRIYLLDAHGELVPAGVVGEIYIGGAGVARGYLNRPELTQERFLADPFLGDADARMYRTGDLGRWSSEGMIEYLGRNDFQVKIRGFRIELGEIEARLAKHEAVREAAVLAREDVPGDKRLVAYYVADAEVGVDALRAHLQAKLPEYMVPAAFVWLEQLPLTPNGKLDRKALPAPEGDAFPARVYEPPVGETERVLAGIWAELLGVERVGREDDFFALGGHSLRAVQVVSRVRQELGAEVSLAELFTRPVLADYAAAVEGARRAELPPIEVADRSQPLPLSFAQQRLWFLEQLSDLGATYHMPFGLRLRGELDQDALERALDRIVERHEALRTVFHTVEGEVQQQVTSADKSGFHLLEHDLSELADTEAELQRLVSQEASTPFDLEQGPLIRGRLIQLAGDDYVLLVTMHHIVSDGWSTGVMVRELSALYAAFLRGGADPLPALPVQYADYAAWQRKWVDGEVLQQQADYWARTLAGAPELLELPTDRPRPAVRNHGGATLELELDEALSAGLKALGQRNGATLFHTLLAGWAAVLGRLSGQDEVVIGTPSANRGRAEIEGLIGFFVNTLALRIDLSDGPTTTELLGRVKERALGAQQNQDIPFEQVVERVQPARSMAHTPLFQVMFSWQNNEAGSLELPGLTLHAMDGAGKSTAKGDLTLALQEDGGRIVGSVTYATALFDRETVERHVGYLRGVLTAMVAMEEQTVDRLPLLSPAERTQVLATWNATDAAYPGESCIHQLIEQQVARTPDAVAVVHEDRSITYAELNARANRLAHHLRTLGVGPDARVAICVEPGPEAVVGLLAILKAGGAYVPLDPAYPADRLQYMLGDSAPVAVLTQGGLRGLVAGAAVPLLALDEDAGTWAAEPATNPEPGALTSHHLAYVIYTSGSTGAPKGVMVPHRNAVGHLHWVGNTVLAGVRHLPWTTNLSFDASLKQVFGPLLRGDAVWALPASVRRDPDLVLDALRSRGHGVALNCVPSFWAALLARMPAQGAPTGLVRLALGGEAVTQELVERTRALLPELEIWNLYGPTETTVNAVAGRVVRGRPGIGAPIANTRVYVLDPRGEPVPVGVVGELYVGGAGVARGYLGRPELTEERFVTDPFSSGADARMYRTGDLGRWLSDGTVEFLGRNDFQVKVRGFRIELGEIEARLSTHPQLRETVVLARQDAGDEKRLVAYYVADAAVEVEALRAHLLTQLPEYMVPAAYVWLEQLPLTPNGKLDRRALPAPEGDAFLTRAYEAPQGEVETALAAIWAELLGVERVGRNDHFFDVGGHSLLATRLIVRIRQEMEVETALRTVFELPVLWQLAEHLLDAQLALFDADELAMIAEMMPEGFQ